MQTPTCTGFCRCVDVAISLAPPQKLDEKSRDNLSRLGPMKSHDYGPSLGHGHAGDAKYAKICKNHQKSNGDDFDLKLPRKIVQFLGVSVCVLA